MINVRGGEKEVDGGVMLFIQGCMEESCTCVSLYRRRKPRKEEDKAAGGVQASVAVSVLIPLTAVHMESVGARSPPAHASRLAACRAQLFPRPNCLPPALPRLHPTVSCFQLDPTGSVDRGQTSPDAVEGRGLSGSD